MVRRTDGDNAGALGCFECIGAGLAATLLVDDGRSGIVVAAGRMRAMAEPGGVAVRIERDGQRCRRVRWAGHCIGWQKGWVRLLLRVREGQHFPRMGRCASRRR